MSSKEKEKERGLSVSVGIGGLLSHSTEVTLSMLSMKITIKRR